MTLTETETITTAWNTVLFDKFTRFRHLICTGLGVHSAPVLARTPYAEGQRVLDIGCGFGDTTLDIARQVGPTGSVMGFDCAERYLEVAASEARQIGVDNVRYATADVQLGDLGGPWDHAFSRFGTMFCALPGAAMRNVLKHLKPGGELTMIVWRKREDNPWLYAAEQCVRKLVPVVDHDETDQVHCGPGPFSMAGPDMVSDLLMSCGFERVRFERQDRDILIGRDVEEAVAFAEALGPAGEILRLAGEEGERLRPSVLDALREELARHDRGADGVWAGSSAWVVRAQRPA